jgi:hypothetical protein
MRLQKHITNNTPPKSTCFSRTGKFLVYTSSKIATVTDYKNILIYIRQDATLHGLFYLETALHVLGGTTTHHHERKQLYLQHLVFVTPLLFHDSGR